VVVKARTLNQKPPGYLRDPNFYRLGHQLVMLRANAAALWRWKRDERFPAAGRPPLTRRERSETITAGHREAVRLVDQTLDVLTWFEARDRTGSRLHDLDAQERRLQRFLAGTIEPCITLAIAGFQLERAQLEATVATPAQLALLERGPRYAVEWVSLPRVPRVTAVPWSSRAFYNLACLAALRGEAGARDVVPTSRLEYATGLPPGPSTRQPVDAGLWALGQALSRSHGSSRATLLESVEHDPALQLMTLKETAADLKALLAQYQPPTPTERQADTPRRKKR
jgi:hypothetical protein